MTIRPTQRTEFDQRTKFFYLFGPSVKNLVLQFSIDSVLRIQSTVLARMINPYYYTHFFSAVWSFLAIWFQPFGSKFLAVQFLFMQPSSFRCVDPTHAVRGMAWLPLQKVTSTILVSNKSWQPW